MAETPPQQPRRKRFIPKYEVEGVHKVVLGEETQMFIEMVVGSDINAQYPWKLIQKDKILESLLMNGDLSEFYPLKEELETYENDVVFMGYIPDESKDEDEFYVCCTEEARNHCQQQSERFIRRQEKKLEKAVQKKPRPWTSLGSEIEIIELVPVNTRLLMEMEVKTKFPTEYDPEFYKIRDTHAVRDGFIELTPYRQKFNTVFSRRIDCAIQAEPGKSHRFAQTELRYPKNVWTQSIADALGKVSIDIEGGGDTGQGGGGDQLEEDNQEIGSSESEDEKQQEPLDEVGIATFKAAFRRLRRPSYIKSINGFMTGIRNEMDSIIELNTVMDIYCNDYPNLITEQSTSIYDSMTFEEYVCFTDIRAKDKFVSSAVFHPMWTGIVAISYSDSSPVVMKGLSTRPDPINRAVYGLNPVMIWSHIDSLFPKLYLEAPREVKVLSFCPFDENLLIGGCVNGQVIVWDITNKLENVEKMEVLSEKREKYRIAMNSHMEWMKPVQDISVVQATVVSNLMTSHYGSITAIKWLSPNFIVTPTGKAKLMNEEKKSLMFFTGSVDGNLFIWNLSVENVTMFEEKKVKKSKRVPRRPSALLVDLSPFRVLDRTLQPCYKIILGVVGQPQVLPLQNFAMNGPVIKYTYKPRNEGKGRKYFSCEILPQGESEICTTLYCGSQHGELRKVSWEGHDFNTGEMINSEYGDIDFRCYIHDGIVSCTHKNPFLTHVTLTVGGKIFAVWDDKLKGRPITWKKRPCRLTDGAWSLYKPSLLFITNAEGNIESWDLLLRSDQPTAIQTLSGTMLTNVSLHTLPLTKNITAVGDANGSLKMFLDPPIFMIESPSHVGQMETLILKELKVMQSFIDWQNKWMQNNPQIILELKRIEGALLAEKEEEKRRLREEEEKRLEEEAEARRLAKNKVLGPAERWEKIIQKLIEKTIAVKKRINREELIEHEKPLRELEEQRLEKERRMLDIMKNQKQIFNDTVTILFPEAIKKLPKPKKTLLSNDKHVLKQEFLEDYEYLKINAFRTVHEHPYKVEFDWDATLAEGKERRQALSANEGFITLHKVRLDEEIRSKNIPSAKFQSLLQDQRVLDTQEVVEEETLE